MGTIPMRVGEAVILVETIPVAGSEPTSRLGKASDQLQETWLQAQLAIVELASSTVAAVKSAAGRAAAPSAMEVEFGLKFSAKGNVILAGASGEASLKVKLLYQAGAPEPDADEPEESDEPDGGE